MWLLIDDVRNLGCDITCRTGSEGLWTLKELHGQIDVLCIDHDLGIDSISGYDVISEAVRYGLLPPRVQIVSSNPVGVQRIANVLKDEGYTTVDGRNFTHGRFVA
jgi:hypothetical protein